VLVYVGLNCVVGAVTAIILWLFFGIVPLAIVVGILVTVGMLIWVPVYGYRTEAPKRTTRH
jgi:hypothetical protein